MAEQQIFSPPLQEQVSDPLVILRDDMGCDRFSDLALWRNSLELP
ncbi:hypothetical protein [Microcoleus sp. EPA2]